ncbi:MAG: sulfotransferase family protein [Cyanobacteria bacterium RM1_2_2]|nr:sulfotransferase family protein [Cyanobacteria bacterium RM1_2_2]
MQSSEIEYRLKPDDPLCFIRIPKTGSTTLLSVLNSKFSADQLCPILEGEIFDTVREDLAKYRFFGAHHGYDIHIPIGRKPVFFTYLRHPVDRAISFFRHRQSDFSDGEFAQFLRAETAKAND